MKHLPLDTTIVIDVLADRRPFSEASSRLLDYADKGRVKLYVSALAYTNIYYVLRKTGSHKQLISLPRDLEALVETLDVTKNVISKSLRTDFKDFEDAIQFNTAVASKKVTAIITRNSKDFKNETLPTLTPDEALSMIESSS